MLPPPTPPSKGPEKENDGGKVGGFWIDLAKDWSENGTSTPAEEEATMIPPAPTKKDTGMIPPAPTKNEASMTPPVPTKQEACTTPPAPT